MSERPNRIRGNTREAEAARLLGLGEERPASHRWDPAKKSTVWVHGGVFLSDAELAAVREHIRNHVLVHGARVGIGGTEHLVKRDTIKPPKDAGSKAADSYRVLLSEAVAFGRRTDAQARRALWHRARAFYGLPANCEPPTVEVTESHSDLVAALAVFRNDIDGDIDEESARRAKRLRRRRTWKSRGYVKGARRG